MPEWSTSPWVSSQSFRSQETSKGFCPQNTNDIEYDVIMQREAEIDEFVEGFVCNLVGANALEERDRIHQQLQDELESLKDELEDVMARHGVFIYRPTVVKDAYGNAAVVSSIYEVSE